MSTIINTIDTKIINIMDESTTPQSDIWLNLANLLNLQEYFYMDKLEKNAKEFQSLKDAVERSKKFENFTKKFFEIFSNRCRLGKYAKKTLCELIEMIKFEIEIIDHLSKYYISGCYEIINIGDLADFQLTFCSLNILRNLMREWKTIKMTPEQAKVINELVQNADGENIYPDSILNAYPLENIK